MLEPGREPRASTLDVNQPKETHKRGCYLALTFGTLLSSQGADAHDTRPFGLRSRRLFHVTPFSVTVKRRVQDPGSMLGAATPSATGVPGSVLRVPLSCWAGGAWSDPRGGDRVSVSRAGLAGRREKVTWVSSGLSNRCGVTPDTGPEPHRHAPFTCGPGSPPRRTPATARFPLRSTSQPPGSQSSSAGTASASVTRWLFR
jgi:hypothetical protein